MSRFSFFPSRKYSLVAAVSNLHIYNAECDQLRHELDNAMRQVDEFRGQNDLVRLQIEESKKGG